jgi:hypothetical protein
MVVRSWKASFQAKFNVGFMEAGPVENEYIRGPVLKNE